MPFLFLGLIALGMLVTKILDDKYAEEQKHKNKDKTYDQLMSPMTQQEILDYNRQLLINSAGWMGGSYTEKSIKTSWYEENKHVFSDEQRSDIEQMLNKL